MRYFLTSLESGLPSVVSVKGRRTRPEKIIYPERDGKRMSDNTKQFNWIVKIKEGLEVLFADRPDVFVAGDLLWYPIEGNNKIRTAPDAMVAFGRPKGDRGSYRQWEEGNIAPQVVFEILSPGNTAKEMNRKFKWYERYGVEEYYVYDPDKIDLKGWIRREDGLVPAGDIRGRISPRLGIRFEIMDNDLNIFRPDGQKFLNLIETEAELEQERQIAKRERQRAEWEKQRAEWEKQRAEQEKEIAKREKQRADQEKEIAKREKQRADLLEAKLKALGLL